MNILHLTDFHFSNDSRHTSTQLRLIDSLIQSLKDNPTKIEFVFFTGDLVFSGKGTDDFFTAKQIFLDKISIELGIKRENIIICPGNHDVYRGQEMEGLAKIINDISTNDEIDDFVKKQNKKSLNASLENLQNYLSFQDDFYDYHIKKNQDIIIDGMYTSHRRIYDSKSIGITTINSAWRSNDSKTDSGNLLYPISYLKDSYEKIKDCDLKILLMHHPLSDFKYWNAQKLEDIIYKDYHILFSGHTHQKRNSLHITPNIGIYHCTSSASLDLSQNSAIGYTIININIESLGLKIKNFIYEKGEEEFYSSKDILAQIPIDNKKAHQNKFRQTIRKRFDEKLDEANKLFLSYKDMKEENNFLKLFTDPIIKNESQTSPQKRNNSKPIALNELKDSKINFIVFGRDKSGKSAILYKVLLDNLNEYSYNNYLPIYIDCKNYSKSSKTLNIVDELKYFYELNRSEAESLSQNYNIKILLDNLKKGDHEIIQAVEEYLKTNNNTAILATASETLLNSFGGHDTFSFSFENVFIHDITRKEIRLLTEKWPNLNSISKDTLLEKIQTVFKQLNIPSNYWTVSLFIWIFEKNSNVNLGSNFQLIELYVDNLLDKDSFILDQKYKIDFEDLKNYLAELAHKLVTNYSETDYQMTYVDLVNFTNKYKKDNKKFVIGVEDIINLVIDKGILKKGNESYTFRLNGVFEFFLGHYMSVDHEFRDKIVNDDNFYLSFGNELEICAGINMYDFEFVKSIFERTKKLFSPVNSLYQKYNTDYYLLQRVNEKLNLEGDFVNKLKAAISNPLSPESQDVIFEEINPSKTRMSEVQLKKYYDCIDANSENLEKSLYILARVFRNSKLRNKEEFNAEVFDYILESTTHLGFTLLDEIEENKISFLKELTEEELMRLVTKFIPIVMQTFFYDAMVQGNMENIIKEKINELKKKTKGNELKLLILYYSLIDLDFKNNEGYIIEVINLLKIPILKHTSLIKLYIYLAMKVNNNKSLEHRLKDLIKEQEIKLNNKKNKGLIEQGIAKLQKSNFFNKK